MHTNNQGELRIFLEHFWTEWLTENDTKSGTLKASQKVWHLTSSDRVWSAVLLPQMTRKDEKWNKKLELQLSFHFLSFHVIWGSKTAPHTLLTHVTWLEGS